MAIKTPAFLSRRSFLWKGLAVPTAFVLAACTNRNFSQVLDQMTATPQPEAAVLPTVTPAPAAVEAAPAAVALTLPPTPACGDDDDDDVTIAQTEGPYFTPNSPERTSLIEADTVGTPMIVTGYVLGTTCAPVAGALVDFWHCNDSGQYDNVGYKLRGHQFTDANGAYRLETIRPGLYPGRTRHFHVKVQAPNQPILTTQLYFPGEPDNAGDGIYNAALEMDVSALGDGVQGLFNFVLEV